MRRGKGPAAMARAHNDVMALPHARPLDVVDVRPLGAALDGQVSRSLLRSSSLQLMRVVLRRGESLPEHRVPGEITVHCLEGEALLSMPSCEVALAAGQLVLLPGGEPHAVRALSDTSLLVTLHLPPPPP